MKPKREPSLHQKQMRFFTVFFGTLLVLLVTGLLWVLNHVGQPGR